MRQPTPVAKQLDWWRNAVATGNHERNTDDIHCGWFKRRERARSKTWIPVRIYLDQQIDPLTGELTEPERFVLVDEGRTVTDQETAWALSLYLSPVSLDEFRWLNARRTLHRVGLVHR